MNLKNISLPLPYDLSVPTVLKQTQEWFASIIARPIDKDSQMMPISPSGQPMIQEAPFYISPSPTLAPHQRIQIYNQQYWWRLLTILHESFPLLTRLFGYLNFNLTIGMPYLYKYPPSHWSLTLLGSRLLRWIEEEYHEADKSLIYDCASIDWAFEQSFCAKEQPFLNSSLISEGTPFFLQPHLFLFALDKDLFSFRVKFIKEGGDYWVIHDFPEVEQGKSFFFVIFRTRSGDVLWKELSLAQYQLLRQFQNGTTLTQACENLEKHHPDCLEEASHHIQVWFQEWAAKSWLYA